MIDIPDDSAGIPVLLRQALGFHQAGRLAEAEDLYRRILGLEPTNAAARHHLGKLAVEVGRPSVGLPLLRSALDAEPGEPAHWLACIDAFLRTGQEAAARQLFDIAAQRGIGGEAIARLAEFFSGPRPEEVTELAAFFGQRRFVDGERAARRLTSRYPRHGTGWKALGVFLRQQGRLADAADAVRQGAAFLPWDAEAQFNLGVLLSEVGDIHAAIASYRRALAIRREYPEALNSLGLALRANGTWDDAEASFRQALDLRPEFPEALSNLGSLLRDRARPVDAVECYRAALRYWPDHPAIQGNLGAALRESGHSAEALPLFRRVSAAQPGDGGGYLNLALAHHYLGHMDEARKNYRRAFVADSGNLQHAVSASFFLPCITSSIADLAAVRSLYRDATAELAATPGAIEITADAEGSAYFLLAYHGRDNRELIEGAAAAIRRRIPALGTLPAIAADMRRPRPAGGRMRVGFLSQFFCDHTIGRLNRGFIRHLDRTRFEVVVLHTAKTKDDDFRKEFDGFADGSSCCRLISMVSEKQSSTKTWISCITPISA